MQSTPSPTISPCQLPADNADGVMAVTPPAGCEVGTQYLAADFVGPELTFADWPTVRGIMRLKRAINEAPALEEESTPQHLDALGNAQQVVDTLNAQRPPRSWRSPLALQFTQPGGFWMRVHPACTLPEVLYGIRSNRAQRGQA